MFHLSPEIKFSKRLALWWSVTWRMKLINIAILAVLAMVGMALVVASLLTVGWQVEDLSIVMTIALLLTVLLQSVVCLPPTGYMVQKGFAAHGLATNLLTFKQATLLGLTTFGWASISSLIGVIPTIILKFFLTHPPLYVSVGLQLGFVGLAVVASMYIVLPRQALRLVAFDKGCH